MGFESDYYGRMEYEEALAPNGSVHEWDDTTNPPILSEKVELEQRRLAYTIQLVQAGIWKPNGKPQVKLTELETAHLENIINLVSRKNYYSSYNDVCNLLNPLLEEFKSRQENQ
jgi:hypothetical protein